LSQVAHAQTPDPCTLLKPQEAAALVTLNQADVDPRPTSPGRCYYSVTPSLGSNMDVELTVTDLHTHAAAVARMQQDGPFQFNKKPALVRTSDPGDHVYDLLQPNGDTAKAVHGQYLVDIDLTSTEDAARNHPSFEYRLQRAALEAAGAIILPTPGVAPDPVLPTRAPASNAVRDEIAQGFRMPWYFSLLSYLWIVGPVIAVFVLYRFFVVPRRLRSRLATTGLPGMALIESVSDTGVTINGSPQVRYDCTLTPANGERSYRASTKMVVSRLVAPASLVGRTLAVKIDPANPQSFIFIEPFTSAHPL
jgi:hypothetical protein